MAHDAEFLYLERVGNFFNVECKIPICVETELDIGRAVISRTIDGNHDVVVLVLVIVIVLFTLLVASVLISVFVVDVVVVGST